MVISKTTRGQVIIKVAKPFKFTNALKSNKNGWLQNQVLHDLKRTIMARWTGDTDQVTKNVMAVAGV